ncbi:cytochrome C5 [Rhodococcus sp. W8901]|uniref:cytochrome C5 n=1 Tax=Rhodococcus sp. W8901 TaxID=2742603 RepID=UPI001583C09B|nr:cytochrome C5 [Rhodococcus sp. W8901]QKT13674.1 cytochrome C5 [Rhodococcus sp. W8901]
MDPIELLRDEIAESGLLTAPFADDGIVIGAARVPAAGTDVTVNVDPELEDRSGLDTGVLLAAVERVLTIAPARWDQVVDSVANEIEDAVGDQSVIEATDLRDDLTLRSVAVLHDAVLLSFIAPKQFPDSWIRTQLDEDLDVDDVVVEEMDENYEVVEFESLDDLMDHLSSAEDR